MTPNAADAVEIFEKYKKFINYFNGGTQELKFILVKIILTSNIDKSTQECSLGFASKSRLESWPVESL